MYEILHYSIICQNPKYGINSILQGKSLALVINDDNATYYADHEEIIMSFIIGLNLLHHTFQKHFPVLTTDKCPIVYLLNAFC